MTWSGQKGWLAEDIAASSSWRVPYSDDSGALSTLVRHQLDAGPGFALVTGVPIAGLSPAEASRFAPRLMRQLGEPLPQGPDDAITFGWLVRDEGSARYRRDGTFTPGIYTSKSHDELDIHNDGAMSPYGHEVDLFGLLCLGSAAAGGQSVLLSTFSVVERLRRDFPEDLDRLRRPFAFERTHVSRSGQTPFIWAPVIDDTGGRLRVRCNRQRIEMAPPLTGIELSKEDIAALDALDSVLSQAELQFWCTLAAGDLLVVDDNLIVHAREAFVDDPGAGQERCLVRVLLQRPAL